MRVTHGVAGVDGAPRVEQQLRRSIALLTGAVVGRGVEGGPVNLRVGGRAEMHAGIKQAQLVKGPGTGSDVGSHLKCFKINTRGKAGDTASGKAVDTNSGLLANWIVSWKPGTFFTVVARCTRATRCIHD